MDIALLTTFLSPFLPFLLKVGEKASEKAGEQLGADAWDKAKAVWAKLQPKVEAKAAAQEAVTDVASNPNDEDLQASLRVQLKKLLDQDQDLAAAISQIMQANAPDRTPGTQITQNVKGNQNQVIGQVSGGQVFGNVSGSVVMGGSGNTPPPSSPTHATLKDQPASVKTILVLTANPKNTDPLRLGEEIRKIQAGLERSQYRDRYRIEQRWATTPADVRRALLDCQPQIVHFSGHGAGPAALDNEPSSSRKVEVISNSTMEPPEGLVFEDEAGQAKLVSANAIANLFALFDQIEFVVLNACYSDVQANAIGQHIPYVIGMKRAIGDRAAIEFAVAFYDAILAGRDVDFAYKIGCNAILLQGIPEHLTPTIHKKPI